MLEELSPRENSAGLSWSGSWWAHYSLLSRALTSGLSRDKCYRAPYCTLFSQLSCCLFAWLTNWYVSWTAEYLSFSFFFFFFLLLFPTCILKAGPECPLFNASWRVSACTFMWSWGMCNSVLNFKASHRFCCLHLANLWKWEMLTQQYFHRVRLQEAFSKLWLCILAVKLPVISAGVTQLNPQATLSEDDLYLKED